MTSSKPNVLLIHCHDLGRYLGCYGVDIETPNVDALAADGVLFENHFGTAPQCSPSRGSLMTGCYPHVNGLMGLAHGDWELDHDERILPQHLSAAGYETHLFGLQHVAQDTDRLGYEYVHSEGNLYPGVSPVVHQANRARNVADVVTAFLEKRAFDAPFSPPRASSNSTASRSRTAATASRAITTTATTPTTCGRSPPSRTDAASARTSPICTGWCTPSTTPSGRSVRAWTRPASTRRRWSSSRPNTESRSRARKAHCYNPGIEAALILSHPELASGGRRVDDLVSNVDVLPTLLDLIDVDLPNDVNGRSFAPLLAGESCDSREELFAEMTWHDMYNPIRAIRTEQFKYIRNFWYLPQVYLPRDVFASEAGREVRESDGVPLRPFEELYDLREGPTELDNVANEPRYRDRKLDLSKRLHEWMVETDDPLLDGPIPPGNFDEITRWPDRSA